MKKHPASIINIHQNFNSQPTDKPSKNIDQNVIIKCTKIDKSSDIERSRSITNLYMKSPFGTNNSNTEISKINESQRHKIRLKNRVQEEASINKNNSMIIINQKPNKSQSKLVYLKTILFNDYTKSEKSINSTSMQVQTKIPLTIQINKNISNKIDQISPKTINANVSQDFTLPLKSHINRVNNCRNQIISKKRLLISSLQRSNIMSSQNEIISLSQVGKVIKQSKEVIKTFSKLGKIKIDLNHTNTKTQNILTSKKSLGDSTENSFQKQDKQLKVCKPRSNSQQKLIQPLIQAKNGIKSQSTLLKVKSSQILGVILPDFANIDFGSQSFNKDSEHQSQKKLTEESVMNTNISNMNLELPELNLNHLKALTSISVEDFLQERQTLANKIAYTFRVKKKIPPTTPEYYKLCYVIGRGAFAKVCLGVQVLTAHLVAMKIIEKASLKSDNSKKRIVSEIMILKQLAIYPQIITLYEVFETKKQIFIIMEYVKDGDLMKYVKDNGTFLQEVQAKQLFVQMIGITQVLQKHDILHRDIKLDNLLINSKQQVKVCDFGVSKIIVKGQKITDQCGTPAYLAPEILQNKGGYEGFSSDIWSLGVVLYIMVIGKVPFKGNSMNELNQNIQSGHLNFLELQQAGLSCGCMELIRRMLTINPKQRINLNEIMEHVWVKNDPNLQKQMAKIQELNSHPKQHQTLDPKILNQIEQMGYQKEYIFKSLQKQSLCHINALYVALANKH